MPGTVTDTGTPVVVLEGVYRGRSGRVCGAIDSTNSIKVLLDKRSAYDRHSGPEYAWIPTDFLRIA